MTSVSMSVMPVVLSFVDQAMEILKKVFVSPTSIIFGGAMSGFFSLVFLFYKTILKKMPPLFFPLFFFILFFKLTGS